MRKAVGQYLLRVSDHRASRAAPASGTACVREVGTDRYTDRKKRTLSDIITPYRFASLHRWRKNIGNCVAYANGDNGQYFMKFSHIQIS